MCANAEPGAGEREKWSLPRYVSNKALLAETRRTVCFGFRGVPYAAPPVGDRRWAWLAALTWVSRNIQASTQLFEQLGGSDIEHLRTVPLDQVRQASRVLSGTRPAPGQVHTPANLVWCPTPDGQVVGADLSCWPADMPVLFGRTEHEARYFITPSGPYGAPGVDPASIYTPHPRDDG
jgi:hypothetical protein